MDTNPLTEAPRRDLDDTLLTPGERECLPCYLNRMLEACGCHNQLRWAEIWGHRNSARGLRGWLQSNGGHCDCEVLFNVYPDVLPEDDDAPLDPCQGMRSPGSVQPCGVYDRPGRRNPFLPR